MKTVVRIEGPVDAVPEQWKNATVDTMAQRGFKLVCKLSTHGHFLLLAVPTARSK